MSEAELERNAVLTDFSVRDLNKEPKLPYEDNSFDVITNVVSVDYLNRPLVRYNRFCNILTCSFSLKCRMAENSVLLNTSATLAQLLLYWLHMVGCTTCWWMAQEIFQEMHRVLKPGGLALMSFSNRCFPTKGTASCQSMLAFQSPPILQQLYNPAHACACKLFIYRCVTVHYQFQWGCL